MAWAKVQSSGVLGPAAGTYSPATTAGNLLVACYYQMGGSAPGTETFPAGWSRIDSVTQGSGAPLSYSAIWYYPANPGGITAVHPSNPDLTASVVLQEYSGAPSPLAVTANGHYAVASLAATAPVATTAGAAVSGNLAVSLLAVQFASATKITLTAGSGFTTDTSEQQGVKNTPHTIFDYNLSTGTGTVTDLIASSGTGTATVAGVIVTFGAGAAPAAPPPQVTAPRSAVQARPDVSEQATFT